MDANINFINGVNVEISKMVMRNERDLSYMAYTIVTYLDHDMSTPVSTVTRSYLQFEELNSMILDVCLFTLCGFSDFGSCSLCILSFE